VQDHFYFISSQSHVSVKWLLLWCGNTLSALLAFEPLNLVPSVKTSFHHLDIAIGARHLGLAFFGQKNQNDSG
jgi:hypothetical protein